ncbi:MAG: histidine kinase, partial [Crocinitomicaceae bacterium]|nr:histidine kinase [Crocinitomicaceae bacterium]
MRETKIDMILIFGTVGMLFLAFAVILFIVAYQRRLFRKQQEINLMEIDTQKQLMEAVILAKEKEQKRVAQELHDGIGSALTALKISLIQMNIDEDNKAWIDSSIKSISIDVRRISNELMPSILENMGLHTAMEHLTSSLETSSGIRINYEKDKTLSNVHSEIIELAIYRIIQELLTNIVKYAEAKTISIHELKRSDKYIIQLKDDGFGYIPSDSDLAKPGSLGLKNIHSRVQQIHGQITYIK